MDETESTIAEFWDWFTQNQHRLLLVKDAGNPFIRLVGAHLGEIHPGLFYEFSMESALRELIISANGDVKLFPLVSRIVASAPEMGGWKVIALKPPRGFSFKTKMHGNSLDPQSLMFMTLRRRRDPSFLGLRVAVPSGLDPESDKTRDLVFVILDAGLGEEIVGTMLDYVEVVSMPDDAAREGYRSFSELAEVMAHIASQRDN